MKKITIPILALLLFSSSCTNEVVIDKEAESKAIQTVVESMFKSMAAVDTETLNTFLSEDFLAFDMLQIMKTEDLNNAVAGIAQMGISDLKYTIEPVQSDIYKDNALFFYKNVATANMGEQEIKMEYYESCFMIKTDEGWKIEFLHSTQLPPPATPNKEAE